MKFHLLLPLIFLMSFFVACNNSSKPTIESNTTSAISSDDVTSNSKESSSICSRSEPTSLIDKNMFPTSDFRVETNKEYPHQTIGFETVNFSNGDKLLIEHSGCENFTLIFRFETNQFKDKVSDIKSWYGNTVKLMEQTNKGVKKDSKFLITNGISHLRQFAERTPNLKYAEVITSDSKEIQESVVLEKVEQLESGYYLVEISIGVGPL